MRMDPRAPVSSSPAAERIVPDSRMPLPPVALEATAMLLALGSEAPAPPLPLPASAPAVVALSGDHPLLQALTQAVIERIAVITSPSADRFVDQLVANCAEPAGCLRARPASSIPATAAHRGRGGRPAGAVCRPGQRRHPVALRPQT